MKKLWVA